MIELVYIKGVDPLWSQEETEITSPIFVCDVCHKPIYELRKGMLFFTIEDSPQRRHGLVKVKYLIAHKVTCDPKMIVGYPDGKEYAGSMELYQVLEFMVNNYKSNYETALYK